MWFQKLSIPPPRKGFFLRPHPPFPHLSGKTSQGPHIYLNFWAFETPQPPRNFQFLLWGDYGYFLELDISISALLLVMIIKEENWFCPLLGLECWKKSYFFPKWCKLNAQSKTGLTNKHMNEFEIGPWVWNTFTCINIAIGVKVIQ